MADFTTYMSYERDDLVARYGELETDIAAAHREIANVRADERRAKVHGYQTSEAGSHSARERAADAVALEATVTLFGLMADLESLEAEARFVRFLLNEER